jgi:hypothetical protein
MVVVAVVVEVPAGAMAQHCCQERRRSRHNRRRHDCHLPMEVQIRRGLEIRSRHGRIGLGAMELEHLSVGVATV